MDKSLPFRRGLSYKTDLDAGQTGDPSVIYGRTFPASDAQPGDGISHGTKQSLTLRALQTLATAGINMSSTLTGLRAHRGRKLLEASTLNTRSLMQQISRMATGAPGTFAHFPDDAYGTTAKTFIHNDILYAIEQGLTRSPLTCIRSQLGGFGSGTMVALTRLARSSDGRLMRARTGQMSLAVAMESFSSALTGSAITVYVGGPATASIF